MIKRAVARYAVGAKLIGQELSKKIEVIIGSLYMQGFIVNQVTSDGASENVSALKLLATHKARDVFPSLNPKFPNVLVTCKHPPGID